MLKKVRLIHLVALTLLLILGMQAPFLEADPHKDISPHSRDAFTDEGLNTSQVTNKVNHGYFGVHECDNLIKTPLFNAWIYPAYALFGTRILSGRLWMLFTVLGLLFLAAWAYRPLQAPVLLFSSVFLTQYHLFQYIHFTMAEITASALVLCSVAFFMRYAAERSFKWGAASVVALWAAVACKNQFAYALLLLPVYVIISHFFREKNKRPLPMSQVAGLFSLWLAGGLVYSIFWYLPVKETYDYVMADQANNRFIPRGQWTTVAWEQTKLFFGRNENIWFFRAFAAGLLLLPLNYFFSRNRERFLLSLLLLAWALAECHKLTLWFVPSRYLSPLIFSWAIFASLQYAWALEYALKRGTIRYAWPAALGGIIFVITGIHHMGDVISLYENRTFAIRDINRTLKTEWPENRVAAGPWAPTLARETGAKVIPVWDGYFNHQETFGRFNPKVVIAEWDEADSGGAFRKQGISLKEKADSISEVQVGNYRLLIYFFP
jgi:hypothetical protein